MPTRLNRPAEMCGYADPAYAAALVHVGEPLHLPGCRGSLLVRAVPGTEHSDAVGPYPLFACTDWTQLAADLDALREQLVSVVVVADPLGAWTRADLEAAFPDRLVPFKQHVVVDLEARSLQGVSTHHRRRVRRALREMDVEIVADPAGLITDWLRLYDVLVDRHGIQGVSAFPRDSFARQLEVSGVVACRAVAGGTTVGATLWYVRDDVAHYHLGAYSERGYELGASFGLFARAFEHLAEVGVRRVSLGGAAGTDARPDDGLARFKNGWSSDTVTAPLGGRILQRETYDALARGDDDAYFPRYRSSCKT